MAYESGRKQNWELNSDGESSREEEILANLSFRPLPSYVLIAKMEWEWYEFYGLNRSKQIKKARLGLFSLLVEFATSALGGKSDLRLSIAAWFPMSLAWIFLHFQLTSSYWVEVDLKEMSQDYSDGPLVMNGFPSPIVLALLINEKRKIRFLDFQS